MIEEEKKPNMHLNLSKQVNTEDALLNLFRVPNNQLLGQG